MTRKALTMVLPALLVALVAAACGSGPGGALSRPPGDGGISVEDAIAGRGGSGWVKGYIVAPRGQAVRLCSALAESFPPQCVGPSLILRDGVIWSDQGQTVLGSVIGGVLTEGLRDPEDPQTGRPCTYVGLGPCAGYPSLHAGNDVIWSEQIYSVIGTFTGDVLEAPPSEVR